MIPEFQISKLELREGDTLVVRAKGNVNSEIRNILADYARHVTPKGVKVMVIDDSIELSVLQKV